MPSEMEDRQRTDEILGITRCARCGQKLEGEIECPFCASFQDSGRIEALPKWIYVTACFLTSPVSIYFVLKSRRLGTVEKILTSAGCLFWLGLYSLLS